MDNIEDSKCPHEGYAYTLYTVECMSSMLDDLTKLSYEIEFPHVIEFHYHWCNSTYCTLFRSENDFQYFLSGIKALYMGYRL